MDTMVAYYFLKPQLLSAQWAKVWTEEGEYLPGVRKGRYLTGSEICNIYGISPENPTPKELSFIESEYRKWNWKIEQAHEARKHRENVTLCDCPFNGVAHKRAWEKYSDDKREEWTKKVEVMP